MFCGSLSLVALGSHDKGGRTSILQHQNKHDPWQQWQLAGVDVMSSGNFKNQDNIGRVVIWWQRGCCSPVALSRILGCIYIYHWWQHSNNGNVLFQFSDTNKVYGVFQTRCLCRCSPAVLSPLSAGSCRGCRGGPRPPSADTSICMGADIW